MNTEIDRQFDMIKLLAGQHLRLNTCLTRDEVDTLLQSAILVALQLCRKFHFCTARDI